MDQIDMNMVKFYRSRVQQARIHWTEAMKDMKESEKEERDTYMIDKVNMDACHEICLVLLEHPELPHAYRVVLNLFMSDGKGDNWDLSAAYLRRALAAVTRIEKLGQRADVPSRTLIENQLQHIAAYCGSEATAQDLNPDQSVDSQTGSETGAFEGATYPTTTQVLDPNQSFGSQTGASESSTRPTTATGSATVVNTYQPASGWLSQFPASEAIIEDTEGEDEGADESEDESERNGSSQ